MLIGGGIHIHVTYEADNDKDVYAVEAGSWVYCGGGIFSGCFIGRTEY